MDKFFVIAKREFLQRVRSRAFLFTAIGTPLILIAVWFFTGDIGVGPTPPEVEITPDEEVEQELTGYVDQADLIKDIPEPLSEAMFQSYPDQAQAEKDLREGLITAYFLVSEDYRETGEVLRVSRDLPTSPPSTDPFQYVLLRNLFSARGETFFSRLRAPFRAVEPEYQALDTTEEAENGGTGNSMLPFIVTMAIMLPLFTGGGYLLQSLAQEKGNRVMEVLLVTIRPRQLLTGKLIGLGALVLVQYLIWVVIGGGLFVILRENGSSLLGTVRLTGSELLYVLPFALGGFCLYAALMGGLGALAPDMEGGRSWTFLITLPMMAPIYFWTAITSNPGGTLALVLSLFPYSSPVAMLLRMTAQSVPDWQLGLSLGLLILAVIGTVWAMSRLFHAQSLLSGEPLSLKRFWKAVQSG
ncbi:MAG: ABC transporter permease [Anaerolineales bacterium]|nr:ABC transporter permease [Anaerolineales bacterium]